ncbi:MAG: hypothetical protein M3Z21_10400 [Pseudomonadota bacterium]|nr:hypothetical protein [Pseudomonadota bacterium]
MKHLNVALSLILAGTLLSGAAAADDDKKDKYRRYHGQEYHPYQDKDDDHRHDRRGHYSRHYYDYAKVIHVEPHVITRQVPTYHRECWNERYYHGDASPYGGYARPVLGAIPGDVASHWQRGPAPAVQRQCRTVRHYHDQRQTVGYKVTYRYHGHNYVTRTQAHPGRRIKVRVEVAPAPRWSRGERITRVDSVE